MSTNGYLYLMLKKKFPGTTQKHGFKKVETSNHVDNEDHVL